jgi:hypothetical protein
MRKPQAKRILGYEISPRYDLMRKKRGITQKAKAERLAARNAIQPKQQSTHRKVWGLYQTEKRGAKLLAKQEAPTMAAAVKLLAECGEIEVASIRRKPAANEGSYFCRLIAA